MEAVMAERSDHQAARQAITTEEGFVKALADDQARAAHAKSVFGEPIHQGGVTVVPVARVGWGFGGGVHHGAPDRERAGGGGGVRIWPLGYIEIKDDQSEFKPIRDPATLVPLIVDGGLTAFLLLRGLRKLLGK
jgi:uncharacterized spore protein YtfJ